MSGSSATRIQLYDTTILGAKSERRTWPRIRCVHNAFGTGCSPPAQEVHHIKPLAQGGTHETDNLMALCTSCHSRITAQSGDRWG